jgi:murein L,D-transpeptidase YcbB/YkuD
MQLFRDAVFACAFIGMLTPAFGQTPAPAATGSEGSSVTVPETPVQPQSKLEDLIAKRLPQFVDRKPEQAAVEAFYRERGFQPVWSANGSVSPRARAAVGYLANVASEGLDPSDYPVPRFGGEMAEDVAAANDLQLTASILKYARHASGGRVSFTRVSGSILYPLHPADPAQVLSRMSSDEDIDKVLASFEPQHAGFKALKAELAKELAAQPGKTEVESGFERSEKHHKAEAIHSRVGKVGTLIANMERWRWLPRDLGKSHVIVNIPDYTLAVFDDGKPVWQTKIVVGKPGRMSTPLLSETMKYLTINPTWNVPPSIIRNEYLPALERDPDALERIGLKVSHNPDGSIRVYQPPGARNALGRIRFNFPNPFLVYQHDTPDKSLFARESRALSHGCMRVQNPEQYAEVLLSLSQPGERYTTARIKSLYGEEERTINLQHQIPVHVTYQTAFVDQGGKLSLRSDLYGLDAAILKLMRGNDRQIADTPIPRNYGSSSKPVVARLPARPDGDGFGWGRDDNWDNGNSWSTSSRSYAAYPPSRQAFDRAVGRW